MKNKKFVLAEILEMEKIPRLNLINSLSGFKSASLIGTLSRETVLNLALFNSVVHIGSNPPYMGFILRPTVVPRHTYNNIKETGFFTVNHVHEEIVEQAHQTSAKYPEAVSEFKACGLTPEFSERVTAPYVAESRIKIGLKYAEEHRIKANATLLIVGKIVEIIVPEACLDSSGAVVLEAAGSVAVSGLDTYYRTERLARLDYARPPRR